MAKNIFQGPKAVVEPSKKLAGVIAPLPPAVKQAFYAAANKGPIARGTWDGCAFNAGGKEVGNNGISSFQAAAQAFGISEYKVSAFISVWDRDIPGSDNEATQILRDTIEKVGLFTNPEEVDVNSLFDSKTPTRVVIFESQMKEFQEKLDNDTVEFTDEARRLLAQPFAMAEAVIAV